MSDDAQRLLRDLQPALHDGVYVFVSVDSAFELSRVRPIGTFREREGMTLILAEKDVDALGLQPLFRAAWLTLNVHSELAAVGLTAAISTALACAGIGCNVVAGAYHDHLFVPVERGSEALTILREMSRRATENA